MRKIAVIAACLLTLAISKDDAFRFKTGPIGPLTRWEEKCEERGQVPYEDLLFFTLVRDDKECWITYRTKENIFAIENRDVVVRGSSVKVLYRFFKDEILMKRYFLTVNIGAFRKGAKPGIEVFNSDDDKISTWIWNGYLIEIIKSGLIIPGLDDVKDYYLQTYPPSYTIVENDLDSRKMNLLELSLHMKLIDNAEKYRQAIRGKIDNYAGIMAQCLEETKIRMASDLCDLPGDCPVDPKKSKMLLTSAPGCKTVKRPEGESSIGCPIAMTFNAAERKERWKQLQDAASKSPTLDLRDSHHTTCSFVGINYYYIPVLNELHMTKSDLMLMYKLQVPGQFLPDDEDLMLIR